MKRTTVLVILDGWGIGDLNESNPIYMAEPKTMNMIRERYPSAALQASGIAVGLPWEEEGNSEVGHLTIGAGKIIYQHFPRISMAIEEGTFFENQAIKKAFAHVKKSNSALHIVGLLSEGNVHASMKHLFALLEFALREKYSQVFFHFFTDGKDSAPRAALEILKNVEVAIRKNGIGKISSVGGRYYAMDRDSRWDRTKEAYRALIGEAPAAERAEEAIQKSYGKGVNDELVYPASISSARFIGDGDAVIFFNFREDSMRQITEPFLNPKFDKFPAKKFKDLYAVTFTEYDENFKAVVAFPKEKIENPLGKVLSDNGKNQLRIAETEKYAHVTYFFNGLREKPFPDEYRNLIPSQSILHHDERPEMMAREITDRALVSLNEGSFDFILINYANPDIIAHTGNYDAALKAIKVIDREIDRLFKAVLENDQILLITSDHGNAEVMLDPKTGQTETKHNSSPVPIYLVGKKFEKRKLTNILNRLPIIGLLSDVAPTVLDLMRLQKPAEMTGQSLLTELMRA